MYQPEKEEEEARGSPDQQEQQLTKLFRDGSFTNECHSVSLTYMSHRAITSYRKN